MSLPFTRDQFLDLFRSYNEAIGIIPLLLTLLAATAVALAYSRNPARHRIIAAVLAALWLWAGVAYHWGFFAAINPAARLFGAIFVVEAALLVLFGVVRGRWQFDPRGGAGGAGGIGWLLIVYALAIYPLLGWLSGHGYPNGPSFGAPCPVTIFFLGTTFWITGRRPLGIMVIPLTWAVIGTSAAITLGIYEDFALGASGLLVLYSMLRSRASGGRARTVPRHA